MTSVILSVSMCKICIKKLTYYIIELDLVDFFEVLHFWWKKFKKLILMWNDLIFEGISQANSNLRLT